MMRKEMYEAVKAAIEAEVPEVRHVDLWNRNVEFIEQEDGWERPAVFVEIGPIDWEPLKPGVRRGRGTVRLHMVTDWAGGGQTAGWGLSLDVAGCVEGLRGRPAPYGFAACRSVRLCAGAGRNFSLVIIDYSGGG